MNEILMTDGIDNRHNDAHNVLMKADEGLLEFNSGVTPPTRTLQKEMETASGIKSQTVCFGNMSEYDKGVESLEDVGNWRNPIWNKVVREMVDEEGRRIYAWIITDSDGKRRFELHQQYRSGKFSKVLKISQADVIMATANIALDSHTQKRVNKIIEDAGVEYLNKFSGEIDEMLIISDIIKMLAAELPRMPIYDDDLWELEYIELYSRIMPAVKFICSQADMNRPYFPLTGEDLDYVAETVDLKLTELLKKLKKYKMLYLTTSSRGYQTNVRIKLPFGGSDTEWRYCIMRDEKLDERFEKKPDFDF